MTRYLIPKFTPKRDKEFLYISSFELLHVTWKLPEVDDLVWYKWIVEAFSNKLKRFVGELLLLISCIALGLFSLHIYTIAMKSQFCRLKCPKLTIVKILMMMIIFSIIVISIIVAQRHDTIRDLLTSHISKVCRNVETEPLLQPLDNEVFNLQSTVTSREARLDMKAGGFWTPGVTAFFDVR